MRDQSSVKRMLVLKRAIKSFPFLKNISRNLNNKNERDKFVIAELEKIPEKSTILDAGCGSQPYRAHCAHLTYKAQDFGQYTTDLKIMMGGSCGDKQEIYKYGKLDYMGDVWDIDESCDTFDAIVCTEVFEHIPYPIETIKEFSRLLKKNGKLILTAPSNCLRHMDPYFFYSGFTDRWYEKFLKDHGLKLEHISPVGDYYSWLAVEMSRTALTHSVFAKILLAPAFLYFYNKKKTKVSTDTLCMGYHIVATKI